MKKILLILILAILSVNAFTVRAQVAQCTGLKTTTLPLSGDYGGFGQFTVTRLSITNTSLIDPISVFVPSNATAQNKVPVVVFAHGFGGTNYQFYETLMRQLASNGYIVVFSPYSSSIFATHATRYNQLWDGFQKAVQQLGNIMDTQESVLPDILTARAHYQIWRGAARRKVGETTVCFCL
ncbi:MAG TPA: dienelactone hydrolase family protein [Pyrinomonadaceae bacterium]|nr:dienelactone hydrolase family protein [Pyrinomonadaceae bacterium]